MHSDLTTRERKRLAKLERIVRRGRWAMVWRSACAGLIGGIAFAVAMRLIAPCFGCQPLTPPTGNEAHPGLEWALYSMSAYLGRFGAFLVLCAGLFGAAFAPFGWRVYTMAGRQYEWLAARARLSAPTAHDR